MVCYLVASAIPYGTIRKAHAPSIAPACKSLDEREQKRFVAERPKSKAMFERGKKSLLSGVPMNWMVKWAGAFPPVVREAQGAQFFDVDGHRYVDFCLGDTGAMTGHSPSATVKAIEEQIKRGITLMLPVEDAVFVAEELQKRFGLHLLAVRAHRDRCQSLFDSPGPPDHRPPEDSRLQLVLSRHGRRNFHHAESRWHVRAAPRQHRSAGRSLRHHARRRVQRRRALWNRRWPMATSPACSPSRP